MIFEAVTGGGSTPSGHPSSSRKDGGVQEWIKKQLNNIERILANLAGKAGASLPCIIGSIVVWLLSNLSKTTLWLDINLWALIIAVAGIFYVAAKK